MPVQVITPAEYRTRTTAIKDRVRELGFAGLIALSGYAERDGNVCYLCGHKNAFPYSIRTEAVSGLGYSAFLVPIEGDTTLIAPLGYQRDMVSGVDKSTTGTNMESELVRCIKDSFRDNARLAVAGADILPATYLDHVTRALPNLVLEFCDELIAEQRMLKSEDEIALIKRASKIADEAIWSAVDAIKPGMAESAIGTIARRQAMDAGADYVVRDRIQSGPEIQKGIRWPFASRRKVRKGELVSIDFVGWANSYGFDILRMGCVGRPNKKQRMLIELAGQATEAMSSGLTDNSEVGGAIGNLKKLEKPGFIISPFGHSIGLEIVEIPYLLPGVSSKVKKNMVFCVEPDVRSSKEMTCIENEVIVTSGKPETITKLPVDFWK